MSTVCLISPSRYTTQTDLLQFVRDCKAKLLVLPTLATPNTEAEEAFVYPSVAELQAALDKGQQLFCQQDRSANGKAPRNVVLSRKHCVSLGRVCSEDEIAQSPAMFAQRLQRRRRIDIRKHAVTLVFENEVLAMAADSLTRLDTDLLICTMGIRTGSWQTFSRPLTNLSQHGSVAMVATNHGSNPKSLNKIKTSLKLFNQGIENSDACQWDEAKKLFWLDVPLAD